MTLEFGDPDLEGLKFPRDDPLVITPVLKFPTRNGVGEKMKIGKWPVFAMLQHLGPMEPGEGATYQRLVNKIFAHLIGKTMKVYVDDMLVKILSKADHIKHLGEAFEVLRHYKMMLNPAKCAFRLGSRKFSGHMVSNRGIGANPDKIKDILDMEPPSSIKDVQKLTLRIATLRRPSLAKSRWVHNRYALKLDFPTKNNAAEYEALIADLGLARAVRAKNLKVYGESRLVVVQVNGEFEAKNDIMAKYVRVVKGILTQFDEWYAEHVPKEETTMADALSQFVSSKIKNYLRSIYFQVRKTPTIHVINLIAPVSVTSCWIDPIKTHLETGWLLDDAQQARKMSVRASRYLLIEGLLYKRSFVIPYLKYLRPLEADEVLEARSDSAISPESLTSISTPIPFVIWGMDILGPFSVVSGQRMFIMVAIIYFTKLIEAKALAKITTKQIAQFFWENQELHFTSAAHPQEIGKAEVSNIIILDGLKKKVECSRNTWADELLHILWAYPTTCKVTIEATPFMLAYGSEVVVPLEITRGSPRIEAYEPETNEEGMRLAPDLIDEVIDEANAHSRASTKSLPVL
ncbi:uncharacterized protein LOC141714769 [Apium graveolens]|uniref:uncharacterized protein LOC141714769 n=1 Tax=Apium graveolens TaxID=4045 RepID=UPI003D7981E0